MARDVEYGIDQAAYGSLHDYISTRMELLVFFNACMLWNVMDRAWVNLAIPTLTLFQIQGESGDVYTVADLKNIDA